jgi:hypothetical protein
MVGANQQPAVNPAKFARKRPIALVLGGALAEAQSIPQEVPNLGADEVLRVSGETNLCSWWQIFCLLVGLSRYVVAHLS